MSPDKGDRPAGFGWPATAAAFLIVVAFAAVMWGFWGFPGQIGPEQPIPFSHRVHVEVKKISCLMCHEQAPHSAHAGVPPVETCMLCHSRIIIAHPEIKKVREHYDGKKPILWRKVYELPEFVYFDHSVHIHRSIDCSRCHGDVGAMDRVEVFEELTMGFCVSCHRRYNATYDCFTCHR